MGYTLISNTINRFTNNTDFRTWGSFIANGIANCGLVQTADTGQIDWSTVATPPTTYTMQGYEIYRFNDALQSTTPVYLKMEYGSGPTANTPVFRWSLGGGSTGNGTLLGLTSRDQSWPSGNVYTYVYTGAVYGNNTLISYISGDTGRLVIALAVAGAANTSHPQFLSLERTVDANGTPTEMGVLATTIAGGSPTYGQQVWHPKVGCVYHEGDATQSYLGFLTPQRGGGVTGSNTAVYPLFFSWGGGRFLNPGLNILGYWQPEFTANTPNTFTYYGGSHTYMPLGNTAISGLTPRVNSSFTIMIRWE